MKLSHAYYVFTQVVVYYSSGNITNWNFNSVKIWNLNIKVNETLMPIMYLLWWLCINSSGSKINRQLKVIQKGVTPFLN